MLSSSDCESCTIGELLELEPDAHERLLETWCGYTEPPGGPALRQAIASLYERTSAEEVVATSCAEEGIFLLYHALLRPGDHVIVETPCYESALQVARSTGAEVSQWRRRYEDGWSHDLDALAGLIRPATRLLYLNQPHNPTGTPMARPVFEHVIGLARAHGLVVFSDEVYRELEHDPACRCRPRAISMSGPFRSAASPRATVLLDRNLAIVRRNLPLLDGFFERHAGAFAWIRPTASPIGFPRVTGIGDLNRYCEQLAAAGVLLLPGSVYDQPGHVRIGFGRANMPDALKVLEANLTNGQHRPGPPRV